MSRHASLAQHLRFVGLGGTFVLETGETLEIDELGAREARKHYGGPRLHRSGSLDDVVEDIIIRDRRHLSEDGFVLPIIAINKHTGRSEGLPEIVSRGFVAETDAAILQEARSVVARTLEASTAGGARRLGRHAGKDPHRSKALPQQADATPAADHARNSGSLEGSKNPG